MVAYCRGPYCVLAHDAVRLLTARGRRAARLADGMLEWRLADQGAIVDSAGWDARYRASDLVWGGEPNRFVVDEFTGTPPGRALDIGAGEGRNAIWLAGLGWQVTAVDFSSVAVDRARRLAERRGVTVNWVVADLPGYHPAPGAFDAVVVAYLHLPPADLNVVLGRAAQALAPGGRILVVGHDVANLDHGIGGPQDPGILHTPQAVVAALPGLRVRRAEQVRRPVQTGQGVVDAIDTLVCAGREQAPDDAVTPVRRPRRG